MIFSLKAGLVLAVIGVTASSPAFAQYTFTTFSDPQAGPFPGLTRASGINNNGAIVGYYTAHGGDSIGFLDVAGSYTSLYAPGGNHGTTAAGINDVGQIVGYDTDSESHQHGFLYQAGQYSDLNIPGAINTSAQAINNTGQIVGDYSDANGYYSFLDTGGSILTLSDPNATGGTFVSGINSAGTVVGFYIAADGYHGFLYAAGQYGDIEDPSATGATYAEGINDSGQIVGYYEKNGSSGFIDTGGVFSDVDVTGSYGSTVSGINNAGQIVGYVGGESFLGTPSAAVPEASTTVSLGLLLALGVSGVTVLARRKKVSALRTHEKCG